MGRLNGGLIAVLIGKDGQVRIYSLTDDGATISGTERRRFAVGSPSEGCAVDDAAGQLYIGEEMQGVWRYPRDGKNAGRALVDGVDAGKLVGAVAGGTLISCCGNGFQNGRASGRERGCQ